MNIKYNINTGKVLNIGNGNYKTNQNENILSVDNSTPLIGNQKRNLIVKNGELQERSNEEKVDID